MKADFHIHTDISDGCSSIEEILNMARESGLTHVAITNHDTVEGLGKAVDLGIREGIKVIPGIEISGFDFQKNKKAHILGFNFDLQGKNIKKLCNPILERRNANSISQISTLIDAGYKISIKNIIGRARNSRVIYKQHIMEELIERGYTDEIYSDLYRKLFKGKGICSRDIIYVDAVDAVRAIKSDGGTAVLAHPGQFDSYDMIDKLCRAGLDGLELNHEANSSEDMEKIKRYSKKYDLILTGGSDFHGKYGSGIKLGSITSPKEAIYSFDKDIKKGENGPEEIENFIKSIVREAGDFVKNSVSDNFNLKLKNNDCRDLVTKYDLKIEKFLVKKIAEKYPDHSFITEEKTSEKQFFSEYTWVIDPIDGTTNFVSFHENFSISVALYRNKKPFIGVVYDVMKDIMYSAISGREAALNGKIITKKADRNPVLQDSVIDFSLNTITFLKNKKIDLTKINDSIRGHRAFGSASLSICKIAMGELQGYISAKLRIWDFAAAAIFLKALGGCCQYFSYGNNNKFVFIAAESKPIEDELLSKTNIKNLRSVKSC